MENQEALVTQEQEECDHNFNAETVFLHKATQECIHCDLPWYVYVYGPGKPPADVF